MTKEEKETIITWNMKDLNKADVYTCQPGIWRKLERMGYTAYDLDRQNGKVLSKSFSVPLGIIGIRPMRKSRKKVSRTSSRGSFKKENSKKE